MGYYGDAWKPYVSVAERARKAEKAAAKQVKGGARLAPVLAYRGAVAKTVWGKAWCDNLEAYSDYANRLPRGRSYVRNGSVIDLQVSAGSVRAQVMGSSLYQVTGTVTAVPAQRWRAICSGCAGSIDSLVELLQGRFSKAVMERICQPGTGLFPTPKEITFKCSCPDWASMCKHVAAVLYGVGARLDQQPELLFTLRHVEAKDLVAAAGTGPHKPGKSAKAAKVLEDASLADVFGIEMAEETPAVKPLAQRKPALAVKAAAKKVPAKKVPGKKLAGAAVLTKKVPAKKAASDKAAKAAKIVRVSKSPMANVPPKKPVKTGSAVQPKVPSSKKTASGKSR